MNCVYRSNSRLIDTRYNFNYVNVLEFLVQILDILSVVVLNTFIILNMEHRRAWLWYLFFRPT